MKTDPQWIRNLRATDRARIEINSQHIEVDARVAAPAERDRLWDDVVLARAPFFEKYAEKSGRVIPIAVLTPSA